MEIQRFPRKFRNHNLKFREHIQRLSSFDVNNLGFPQKFPSRFLSGILLVGNVDLVLDCNHKRKEEYNKLKNRMIHLIYNLSKITYCILRNTCEKTKLNASTNHR